VLGGIRNPFQQQVIADPWDRVDADVLSINQKPFEQCLALIDEVASSSTSTCLLMHGEAGSGKTHLMSRLRLNIQDRTDALFLAVRLETVPSRIWRHIRRSLVTDLLRPISHGATGLSRIIGARDLAAASLTISYNLATVLDHYRNDRYRALCTAWLKGEALPDNVLLKMELAADEVEDVSLEEQAHQVVLELCRLAAPAVVVICFDQVEALETYPGDREGLLAYGKAATALHAELKNLLLISLIQSSFTPKLEQGQSYILDRLSLHRAELHQLTREQATQVLIQRMNAEPGLAELRKQHPADILWPLTQKSIGELFETDPRCPARKLLHHAAQQFETVRGAAKPANQTIEEYLESEYSARMEAALGDSANADPDTIMLAGLPVMLLLSGKNGQNTPEHKLIDLVIQTPGAPIAVCLVNQSNSAAVARRLKKISESWNAREFARLRLVRDARLPFSRSAKVTQEALTALRARGAKLVRPSAEAIAALDAIRSVYADAQSGHIAHRGDTVRSRTVLDWLAKRVPVSVQELVTDLMESASEETQMISGLLEFLQKKSIVKLEDAADAIGATAEEVASYARSHPSRVGYLAGPPQVLFDPVSARARPETAAD
jgi:hypothetical protein